jgi:hypothetical protein
VRAEARQFTTEQRPVASLSLRNAPCISCCRRNKHPRAHAERCGSLGIWMALRTYFVVFDQALHSTHNNPAIILPPKHLCETAPHQGRDPTLTTLITGNGAHSSSMTSDVSLISSVSDLFPEAVSLGLFLLTFLVYVSLLLLLVDGMVWILKELSSFIFAYLHPTVFISPTSCRRNGPILSLVRNAHLSIAASTRADTVWVGGAGGAKRRGCR